MSDYEQEESPVRGMAGHLYNEIVEMIKQGYTLTEISEEVGWATGTISKIRREAGFRGRIVDPLAHVDSDGLIEDYRKGEMTNLELAKKYQIRTQQIYKILSLYGEPVKRKDPTYQEARKLQLDDAVLMYEKGYLIWEITRETGVDQPTLHKELHLREVPLRRPRE